MGRRKKKGGRISSGGKSGRDRDELDYLIGRDFALKNALKK
jgi:hypothetical protein